MSMPACGSGTIARGQADSLGGLRELSDLGCGRPMCWSIGIWKEGAVRAGPWALLKALGEGFRVCLVLYIDFLLVCASESS
jgi:hypothetical protein